MTAEIEDSKIGGKLELNPVGHLSLLVQLHAKSLHSCVHYKGI